MAIPEQAPIVKAGMDMYQFAIIAGNGCPKYFRDSDS
jgi:hypothetical protein